MQTPKSHTMLVIVLLSVNLLCALISKKMFKLESYITPFIIGYIDKYVKLKHEDFQLSLWGGDAVLNKLDLRLDAIEEALQLPITIKSGHIHELRIHVPWTKLGSEPVVITVNTIECILKVSDSSSDDHTTGSNTSVESPKPARVAPKQQLPEQDNLPPGYLQGNNHKGACRTCNKIWVS